MLSAPSDIEKGLIQLPCRRGRPVVHPSCVQSVMCALGERQLLLNLRIVEVGAEGRTRVRASSDVLGRVR